MHVVFLFALRVCQVGERLGAQVEGEEVTDRAFRAVDRIGVDGGSVPVAVGGVEIKIPQGVEVGEGIIREQRGDARTRLFAKLQPAGAIERREKMSGRGTIRQQRAAVLEEAAATAVIVERAGRPRVNHVSSDSLGQYRKSAQRLARPLSGARSADCKEREAGAEMARNFFLTSTARIE